MCDDLKNLISRILNTTTSDYMSRFHITIRQKDPARKFNMNKPYASEKLKNSGDGR